MTTPRALPRSLSVVVFVVVLAIGSIAAADAADLVLDVRTPASVEVTGPSGAVTAIDLGVGTVTVGLPTAGLHLVERIGSTTPPACTTAITETSGLVIGADGTTTPLGAAATVDLAAGDEVTCVVD